MTSRAGIVPDLDEAEYHGGPELSATGAKTLLASPAKYRYQMDHPRPAKREFDIGHVVHSMILGVGQQCAPIDADGRTKAGKEARDAALAEGLIPLARADYDAAVGMADAVLTHPKVGPVFEQGLPEQSLFWTDGSTGVACRGRIDWLVPGVAVVDLKTTRDASPDSFRKALVTYGYALQSAWYSEGYDIITGGPLPFIFVAVEKEPPYLVAAYQPTHDVLMYGADRANLARQMFRDCIESGQWPGYPDEIEPLTLPRWAA